MSWETLRENHSEIGDFVERLLFDDARRKLWRKLAIFELGGKGPIGEILATLHGPVFVSRMTMDDAKGYRDDEPDSRQSPLRGVEPVTGDPEQRFQMASRRAQFLVNAGYLIARIQAGERRVELRPGSTSSRPRWRPTAQQIADWRARMGNTRPTKATGLAASVEVRCVSRAARGPLRIGEIAPLWREYARKWFSDARSIPGAARPRPRRRTLPITP